MKDPSIAFNQVQGYLLPSSLNHHQSEKRLADYYHHFVRQHEQSFDVPRHHVSWNDQSAIIDSHANPSSIVEPQKMSSGEVRRVSRHDIQLVQNLIERCLQLYMNQKEVVDTLLVQAKIEPGFTELVWQKLEEENQEFFKAYHVRLMVKHQLLIFNKLLEKQVELMHKICPDGVSSQSISSGSHSSSLHQGPSCYVGEHTVTNSRPNNTQLPLAPSNALANGATSTRQSIHTDATPGQAERMDVATTMLSSQNSHMGMVQGMNGIAIKSEPDYSNSSFTFTTDGNMETRPMLGEFNHQTLNEPPPLLDADISSFGFLGQIPRNFSLSDLTADFSQSSDILENYSRSPFLATDADNVLDSPGRECHDNKQLDTISEGLSYEEFGSD
ncbi:uncharacterized protein LOC143889767 isoform X2 [Tasmannia lanceolata]|uniref:uncharacterized protein LOC143889767 isoform X2 n=1 Tax=Tasmannia lanceolata TaxID=3420 RepID=UPI0040642461